MFSRLDLRFVPNSPAASMFAESTPLWAKTPIEKAKVLNINPLTCVPVAKLSSKSSCQGICRWRAVLGHSARTRRGLPLADATIFHVGCGPGGVAGMTLSGLSCCGVVQLTATFPWSRDLHSCSSLHNMCDFTFWWYWQQSGFTSTTTFLMKRGDEKVGGQGRVWKLGMLRHFWWLKSIFFAVNSDIHVFVLESNSAWCRCLSWYLHRLPVSKISTILLWWWSFASMFWEDWTTAIPSYHMARLFSSDPKSQANKTNANSCYVWSFSTDVIWYLF